MNFWAPVVGHAAVVFSVLKHTGQWGNAQTFDGLARVESEVHIHEQCGRWIDGETVGAGYAWGIHKCVHRESASIRCRSFEPEDGKQWEFLGAVHAAVNGQPTGRQAVLQLATDRTEVARAKEGGDVTIPAGVEIHAEAGKAEVLW